jgi:cytochrome bd-type quinol oxidase subunit 2
MTFIQILNLFNIFVGFFLTATLLVFLGSGVVYLARLGTWPTHRDTAVKGMEWGVVMLVVLILLIALVQLFEQHAKIALEILALVIIAIVAIAIALSVAKGGHEEKEPPRRM